MKTLLTQLLLISSSTSYADQALRGGNSRQLNADFTIFNDAALDGYARGEGVKVGTPCYTKNTVSFVENGDKDYMDIHTNRWHAGGYRMGCIERDGNWACLTDCHHHQNFGDWMYLTFEAKVSGTTQDCRPRIKLVKKWPGHSSQTLELTGALVDGGQLSEDTWTRVVIPMANFITSDWPTLDIVKDIYFLNGPCSPRYQVSGLVLTDSPPLVREAIETTVPTPGPVTSSWTVWHDISHSHAIEDANNSCFIQEDRTHINAVEGTDYDYFTVSPDNWVDGGLQFGCVRKNDSWQCDRSCFPFDGTSPNWSEKGYLTFKAKVEGDFTTTCKPTISLTGGGWPRHNSNAINLEENYVDNGFLVSDEWRRVSIPLEDLKTTDWNLNNVFGLYFNRCTNHSGRQPTYYIADIAVTNYAIDLISVPPSQSPTEYVTDDTLLATHRFVHTNYYPLLGPEREPAGNVWIVAENNSWPEVASNVNPQTVTIFIPEDQTVLYSRNDDIKFDKIVIEGSLTIMPEYADVLLTVGSIVVEKGGVLDIRTENTSPHTVTIEIEGALDTSTDPEEQMIGIIALEGYLSIIGNEVSTKMAVLQETLVTGTRLLTVNGIGLQFKVGGELVLPDTQMGLNVGHWNFPNNSDYVDQTETCEIKDLNESNGNTIITCEADFVYDHSSGFTVGYITRSIKLITSPQSTDRGHLLHTGTGRFEVRNSRIENFGRTTTELIDSTVMQPTDLHFGEGIAQMSVTKLGSNQIARYALHAHHSLVEAYFTGNAALYSPRDGMVAHNSRVHILENVVVGADGTGIFLEDSTETGPVVGNYIIGTGGGTRGGDDGRFSSQGGKDMAHGGFGIWARGKLALVKDNHCEGHFGFAPYAFFVHPNFISNKKVPDVPGTPPELVGKSAHEISQMIGGLELQNYGGFVDNTAVATFRVGIDLSYFGTQTGSNGSIIEGARIKSLASSGKGISTTHSAIFTLNDVTIEGVVADNDITGIWCNNCNGCHLQTVNTTLVIEDVKVVRGGNC